jgi:hypothetical protein
LTGETEIKHVVYGLGPLTCHLLGLCFISTTIRPLLVHVNGTIFWDHERECVLAWPGTAKELGIINAVRGGGSI